MTARPLRFAHAYWFARPTGNETCSLALLFRRSPYVHGNFHSRSGRDSTSLTTGRGRCRRLSRGATEHCKFILMDSQRAAKMSHPAIILPHVVIVVKAMDFTPTPFPVHKSTAHLSIKYYSRALHVIQRGLDAGNRSCFCISCMPFMVRVANESPDRLTRLCAATCLQTNTKMADEESIEHLSLSFRCP